MNSKDLSVSLSGLSTIKARVAPINAQISQLKQELVQEKSRNLELQTRLACNATNFRQLLNTAYLLGQLNQLDKQRFAQIIHLAQTVWIDDTESVPVTAADSSTVGQVRSFLKSQMIFTTKCDS